MSSRRLGVLLGFATFGRAPGPALGGTGRLGAASRYVLGRGPVPELLSTSIANSRFGLRVFGRGTAPYQFSFAFVSEISSCKIASTFLTTPCSARFGLAEEYFLAGLVSEPTIPGMEASFACSWRTFTVFLNRCSSFCWKNKISFLEWDGLACAPRRIWFICWSSNTSSSTLLTDKAD